MQFLHLPMKRAAIGGCMTSCPWVTVCLRGSGTVGLPYEVWQVPLPADLAPGRYEVFTGLYRTRDLERVPASDMDGEPWLDGRVLLGSLVLE